MRRFALRRGRLQDARGQVIVMMALFLFLFILGGIMVIDTGRLLVERRQVQAAVDLSSLAAAQDLPDRANDPQATAKCSTAENRAYEYLEKNGYSTSDPRVKISVITCSYEEFDGSTQFDTEIVVTAKREFNWMFGGFVGLLPSDVGATAVATARAQPRDIVLVLDRSGSMCDFSHSGHGADCYGAYPEGPWEPFDTMREASRLLATVLRPMTPFGETLDRLALVSYSGNLSNVTEASIDAPLSDDFQQESSAYQVGLDEMVPAGWTNMGYGLDLARQELVNNGRTSGPNPASQVVIFLSDGYANGYPQGWSAVDQGPPWANCSPSGCQTANDYTLYQARLLAEAGAAIYTIGYTDAANPALLQAIANEGATYGAGGEFFSVEDPELLAETFFQIASLTRVLLIQ